MTKVIPLKIYYLENGSHDAFLSLLRIQAKITSSSEMYPVFFFSLVGMRHGDTYFFWSNLF